MKSITVMTLALAALAQAIPDHFRLFGRLKHAELVGRAPDDAPPVVTKQPPQLPPQRNASTAQGCFTSRGNLKYHSYEQYNSLAKCGHDVCAQEGYMVAASVNSYDCYCGNEYPPLDTQVDDSKCTAPCGGFPYEACGGLNDSFFTVYNTGVSLVVKYEPNSTHTSSSSSPSATHDSTPSSETVLVTQTSASDNSSNGGGGGGGGTNVGGIVAGVVVAVVVVAAAIGGVFFWMRRKRNQEIEEAYRRNASVNNFLGKPPGSSGGNSITDARLDPVMAQRRMSDGSIADNQDYSRRILRVTNA